MNVMTDDETREFASKNSWSSGIRIDEAGHLFYDEPEANCITLAYPATPLRVTYYARLVSMLGIDADEAQSAGGLLWIRLWNIGSPQLEKSGWKIVERMRMGYGELRPLGDANGHWFRSDEITDLARSSCHASSTGGMHTLFQQTATALPSLVMMGFGVG